MLNQNWFTSKNFVIFCDFAEYQLFYDTETKNIYEVSENVLDAADTTIKEYTPENSSYRRLYAAYESSIAFAGLYSVTLVAEDEILVKANSPEEAKNKVKKMYGERNESIKNHYIRLLNIENAANKSKNEV